MHAKTRPVMISRKFEASSSSLLTKIMYRVNSKILFVRMSFVCTACWTYLISRKKRLMYRTLSHRVWKKYKTHSVKKYYQTRSRVLRKNQHFSVKSTFLLKKLLKSWFHEIFLAWSYFEVLFHTVKRHLAQKFPWN